MRLFRHYLPSIEGSNLRLIDVTSRQGPRGEPNGYETSEEIRIALMAAIARRSRQDQLGMHQMAWELMERLEKGELRKDDVTT
jgi:hypothetical protein